MQRISDAFFYLLLGLSIGALFGLGCFEGNYRALQVECGKAHYDTKTGKFVEHEKEAK